MHAITLDRRNVRNAIGAVSAVIDKRSHMPILGQVLLRNHAAGGIEVLGTNLDLSVSARIADSVFPDGLSFCLPALNLRDAEKKAPDSEWLELSPTVSTVMRKATADEKRAKGLPLSASLELEETDVKAALSFGKLKVSLSGRAAEDFPEQKFTGEVSAQFTMPSADLLKAFDATSFAISTEETRYYLNGILFHINRPSHDGIRFIATDGHRLASHDSPVFSSGSDVKAIVPTETIKLLATMLKAKGAASSVSVKVNHAKIEFTLGDVVVLSKLIDGTYPDYQRVIPTGNKNVATFDRKDMSEAIKAVLCLATEKAKAVKFTFADSTARLSVRDVLNGDTESSVPMTFDAWSMEIGFNGRYVLECLAKLSGDNVTLAMGDAGSPAILSTDSDSFVVLMPMRV